MADMKRLYFGFGLMAPSLDGSKRFTVRRYRKEAHNFKKGEIVIGEFKDGLDILITITDRVKKAPFKKLKRSKREAKKNGGYYFDKEYFKDLKTFYPDLKWKDLGAVISFEILEINGIPVVSANRK